MNITPETKRKASVHVCVTGDKTHCWEREHVSQRVDNENI